MKFPIKHLSTKNLLWIHERCVKLGCDCRHVYMSDYEEDFEADDEGPVEDAEAKEEKSPSPSSETQRQVKERDASETEDDEEGGWNLLFEYVFEVLHEKKLKRVKVVMHSVVFESVGIFFGYLNAHFCWSIVPRF